MVLSPADRDPTRTGARAALADTALATQIAALSKVRTRDLTLPPAIMAAYLAHTWHSRRKINAGWMAWAAALNASGAMFAPFTVPEEALEVVLIGWTAMTAMMILGAIAIYASPRHGAEGPITIAVCLGIVGATSFMVLRVGPELSERYILQVIFMCGTAISISRIRWRDTVLLASTVIAALSGLMLAAPAAALTVPEKLQMAVFFVAGLVGLLFARLAVNQLQYRMYVLSVADSLKMAEIEKINGRLHALARTDPLTAVSNRRHFDEMFAAMSVRADSKAGVALFMIDIDYFKRLNDTRGHAAGDECLKVVAELIRSELREGQDFVARFGGEEFVVVLSDVEPHDAVTVAERVRAAIEARGIENPTAGNGVVTASIGVAVSPPARVDLMIAQADAALYEAKASGRNAVRVARPVKTLRVA